MGPNAKFAAINGGGKFSKVRHSLRPETLTCAIGSASLSAYYAVTPYDGLSAQLTEKPLFTEGCYAHKEYVIR